MPDPDRLLHALARAAQAFRAAPGRRGRVVALEGADEVLVAGDLHGNVRNFGKLLAAADLARRPRRHLVLQEVIHSRADFAGPELKARILPGLLRWPYLVIGLSFVVYAATLHFDWNLPGYPDDKVWFFNPMAWQVVFYSGAVLAVVAPDLAWLDRWRGSVTTLAVVYLLFAAFIALSWHYNSLERLIPDWFARQIYPIDKTNLDVLRFVHFLSLAWLVRLMVRPNARFLKWQLCEPIRRCGEHSLQIFCLGTFLAVTAQIIVARYEDSIVSQLAVSLTGLVIMSLAAYGASWFKAGPPARGFVA